LMQHAPDFVTIVNRDHTIAFINKLLFDVDPQSVVGTSADVGSTPEEKQTVHDAIEAVFTTGAAEPYDVTVPLPEAGNLVLSTRLGPIYHGPKVEQVILISTDVTQRRLDAATLALTERKLRHSQKLQAIGELTGGIAHDFNNLLTAIRGSITLARSPGVSADQVSTHLEDASQATDRAASLVARLLSFGRRQSLVPQAVDLAKLVYGLEDMLRRTLGEQVEIEVSGEQKLWVCEVDPSEFENALLNLAINARDAMGSHGGTLRLRWSNERIDNAEASSPDPDNVGGEYVCLVVSDTGPGMDTETMKRAFEPFFTDKPAGTGTGLGLSMVYGFAMQSGGWVTLDSPPGEGLSVRLYLPRSAEQPASTLTQAPPKRTPKGNGELILVVEDQALVARVVQRLLKRLNYQTVLATTAAEALTVLDAHPNIALLFTDVGLPGGVTGLELIEQVQQLRPSVPALITSGYDGFSREDGLEHIPMLKKPYEVKELQQMLHLAMNQPTPQE